MKIQITCTKDEYNDLMKAKDKDAVFLNWDIVVMRLRNIIKRGDFKVK